MYSFGPVMPKVAKDEAKKAKLPLQFHVIDSTPHDFFSGHLLHVFLLGYFSHRKSHFSSVNSIALSKRFRSIVFMLLLLPL